MNPARAAIAPLFVLAPLFALVVAACTLGPNYTPPPSPRIQTYVPPADKPLAPAGTIRMTPGQSVATHWWRGFRSPELDHIVTAALARSASIAAARARLTAAHETDIANRAEPSVQLDTSATISNHRITTVNVANKHNDVGIYAVGSEVSYSPDLFGAVRRGQEKLGALADYAGFEYQAARLSVAGNAALQVIAAAGFSAALAAHQRAADIADQRLALARALVETGKWPSARLASYQSEAAQAKLALLAPRQNEEASRYTLAALSGVPPALWRLPLPTLDDLHPPAELPLELPSALARRRPDIQAAAAQVHAAVADVGIATANLYPTLTISATTLLSLSADITQSLFKWNNLHAAKRASEANLKAALADYRGTVLDAFTQVAKVLRAIQYDQARLKDLSETATPLANRVRLLEAEQKIGRIGRMPLLDAERDAAELQAHQAEARAALDRDIVELYVALGGGTLPDATGETSHTALR